MIKLLKFNQNIPIEQANQSKRFPLFLTKWIQLKKNLPAIIAGNPYEFRVLRSYPGKAFVILFAGSLRLFRRENLVRVVRNEPTRTFSGMRHDGLKSNSRGCALGRLNPAHFYRMSIQSKSHRSRSIDFDENSIALDSILAYLRRIPL